CRYHYSAQIKISAVSQSEMKPHMDEHYSFALVKMAKEFAATFASNSFIISQDNKAKISLGMPAVGRTFKSIQSLNKPVTVSDHNFLCETKQKLILLVYLIINSENMNKTLHQDQLSIYIQPEYFVGTSSLSHIKDLIDISKCDNFVSTLNNGNCLKSIWILLVDRRPDKNPKHLKNIVEYCRLFRELDFDYLSVQTHAPYQSACNSVERSMCTLSEKLAGIELPVDKFELDYKREQYDLCFTLMSIIESHLNSQGAVINEELARRNFEFFGQLLYEIWRRDNIHRRQVCVNYIDYNKDLFYNK
ncbi:34520_t:CDS:2, partial [Gigaspora margarita]